MSTENDSASTPVHADCYASDWDHRIIDATSVAMNGEIGREDDLNRLRRLIEDSDGDDKLKTACEIAMAFMRWSQDLRRERNRYRDRKCVHRLAKEYAGSTTDNY